MGWTYKEFLGPLFDALIALDKAEKDLDHFLLTRRLLE